LETVVKNKLYEAMFLVDSALAAADWDHILSVIRTILKKADAEIVSLNKWDERKLAYEIAHKERGTYILCYFRVGGEKVAVIERDVRLSDQIMRVLILNAEAMSDEEVNRETPVMREERRKNEYEEAATKRIEESQAKAEELQEQLSEERAQSDTIESAPEAETVLSEAEYASEFESSESGDVLSEEPPAEAQIESDIPDMSPDDSARPLSENTDETIK